MRTGEIMTRTSLFAQFSKLMTVALDRNEACLHHAKMTRRSFLKKVGVLGVTITGVPALLESRPKDSNLDVGIVGAGLAGLVCADTLRTNGVRATIYEASTRVGGRCFSLRNFFTGQVAERGGEFIDNLHKTLLSYAQQFNLLREDESKVSGDVFYYFNNRLIPEPAIVDEFRSLVAAMRRDLTRLSKAPTADSFNPTDAALDNVSLSEYLETRGASPLAKAAITAAYEAEYGLPASRQSCLNFLLFIHADRRSKFTPFGVFSDERYHLVDGNDAIATGIAALLRGQIEFSRKLVRVAKTAAGRIELTFAGRSPRSHDAVVLAIPFTVLRSVDLHSSLSLPAWKLAAIQQLGYGTNAKMMIQFNGQPWRAAGSNGASYSDQPNVQATWETNHSRATAAHAVLTDYSSGNRGAALDPAKVQLEAAQFLTGLDLVYPGAFAMATRDASGAFVAHLEHWPSNPLSLGSYTCYLPGQFTSIGGNEGKPVDNLYFAGEHTNSFYGWQGFMEGAAMSGVQTANQILSDFRNRD
jgi:monoamine oxidase